MKRFATVVDGVVDQIRPESEADPGSVSVPHWCRTGDLWNNGDPLKPDGTHYTADEKRYSIPVPLFVRRFENEELASLWVQGVQNPAFGVLLVRTLGSVELDSDNPAVLSGKVAVAQVLGQARADELFSEP